MQRGQSQWSLATIWNVLDRSRRSRSWWWSYLRLLRYDQRYRVLFFFLGRFITYSSSGSTLVLHDSESPTDVGHCTDPGCYSRAINYNASNRQMTALAQLSSECHQSIKVSSWMDLFRWRNLTKFIKQYDCIFAPLELNDVAFCWWNDRSGNSKYFWSGGNTDVHTCQCGIDGNCVETYVKCNCDAAAPIQLSDDGKFELHSFAIPNLREIFTMQVSLLIRISYLSHAWILAVRNWKLHPASTHWVDLSARGKQPSTESPARVKICGGLDTP